MWTGESWHPPKIIELYKQGFSVTSQNAKAIVAFLQDILDRGIENGTIPVSLVTSKMGWTEDKSAFIPYTDEKIMFNDQGKFSKLPKALEPKGDSKLWYEVMKKERDIEMVQLLLAANLAAPVVGPAVERVLPVNSVQASGLDMNQGMDLSTV